jgi:guanylate kinase
VSLASPRPARSRQATRGGILFALDGASGSGKTTLAFALVNAHPDLTFVPRYTTRTPRNCESDAREYLFVTPATFSNMIAEGAFVEHRCYEFGMRYGTGRKEVDAVLDTGRNAVIIINLGNVTQLKAHYPRAVAILIDVSLETLQQRLIRRGANTAEQIAERLANARAAGPLRSLYDDIVHNEGDLDRTLSDLTGVVEKWLARRAGI